MATFDFSSVHRLHHSHEFDAVFRENELRVADQGFLFLAKRNERGFNRLGLVVSKKNMPRAVDRNRTKRQIREAFRLHLSDVSGLDVIVLCRATVSQDKDTVRRALLNAFARLTSESLRLNGSLRVGES